MFAVKAGRIAQVLVVFTLVLIMAQGILAAPSVVLRNNHEVPINAPFTFRTQLPDGFYKGRSASMVVSGGSARGVANLPIKSQTSLVRAAKPDYSAFTSGHLGISIAQDYMNILWKNMPVMRTQFGLMFSEAESGGKAPEFHPLNIKCTRGQGGVITGKGSLDGYDVNVSLTPYGGGWVDMDAVVTNAQPRTAKAYVALARRVTTGGVDNFRARWAGIKTADFNEPEYSTLFNSTQALDWSSWSSGGLHFASLGAFNPGLTTEREPGRWVVPNQYYIWERARKDGDGVLLISEISGNLSVGKQGYSRGTQLTQGDSVRIITRLALTDSPKEGWEDSQFLGLTGYHLESFADGKSVLNIGAPYVEFGTSYFPYSTMCENFDYYRTPTIDREGWWPFSPQMWENWRAFAPQMQTDLRIIRAMGMDWVRLHHLELIGEMDKDSIIAFMDFFIGECRKLNLKVMADIGASPEWTAMIAGRYKDIIKRVEIENEVLIPGITKGAPERWTAIYNATKKAAPDSIVFLTGISNQGVFDRLQKLNVPFDQVGQHYYKHRAELKEILPTVASAATAHASRIGRPTSLSEFNWKFLTRLSPEERAKEFKAIYSGMLQPRAFPEFYEFHWQETMSVNPSVARKGIRHYETIYLDRRLKPEGVELMKLIKQYSRADAPIRELTISAPESVFANGRAKVRFSIINNTSRPLTLKFTPECFGDAACRLVSKDNLKLAPGAKSYADVEVALKPNAMSGVYHFFLRADYSGKAAYGWGIASQVGVPKFEPAPVLADKVDYPQGADIVNKVDWNKIDCVAFRPNAGIIELEMAYMLFNTLQSTTGRRMRLCSTADIPQAMMDKSGMVLVGSVEEKSPITDANPAVTQGKGTIILHDAGNGRQWLLITGEKESNVNAAAIDVLMRYWKNAKDSSMRITGLEPGLALGHKNATGLINPP